MRGPTTLSLAAAFVLVTGVALAASPQDLVASGHVDDAVQMLEQQVRQAPDDAAGYNLLCRAYLMMEEWDRGITNCERARNLDPQNSFYYVWLGRIYGEKADRAGFLSAAGLGKKSRSAFERAVELDPRNWEARKDLAEFYFSAPGIVGGGKDKAQQQADAIRALNPAAAVWVDGQIAEKTKTTARPSANIAPPLQPLIRAFGHGLSSPSSFVTSIASMTWRRPCTRSRLLRWIIMRL
jgi:cytochrome c-type biogenesis protein CcmH/NrfG